MEFNVTSEEFESNSTLIQEIFPNYSREKCKKWLKLFNGDVGRVCDYLAQCPDVVDTDHGGQAGHSTQVRSPAQRRTFDETDRASARVAGLFDRTSHVDGIESARIVTSPSCKRLKICESECTAKALYSYEASQSDELTIREGDIITCVKKRDNGWFEGKVNGKSGVFPGSFVELNTADKPKSQSGFKAKVLFESKAEVSGELALATEDVIDVIDTTVAPGWWFGRSSGNVGIFPSSFVEVLDEKPSPEPKKRKGATEKESRITYDRQFLLDLKRSTVSSTFPNLPNIPGVILPGGNMTAAEPVPLMSIPVDDFQKEVCKPQGSLTSPNAINRDICTSSTLPRCIEGDINQLSPGNIARANGTQVRRRAEKADSNKDTVGMNRTPVPRETEDYTVPGHEYKDLMSEQALSQTHEEALINFFDKQGRRERGSSENKSAGVSEGVADSTSNQNVGRRGEKGAYKREKICGRVKMVNKEKKFGFITLLQNKPAEDGKENDVFFHFDKVRAYLFSLKAHDIVQYSLYEDKKKKVYAVNVNLVKPARRSYSELSDYLDLLCEEIASSKEEKKPNSNIAQILGSPNIWNHLSEAISTFTCDGNDVVLKLVDVICKLESVVKSLDESFKQVLSALTNPAFFSPYKGRLKEVIKETSDANQLQLLQTFLLLVAKYVPDKIPAIVALTKPIAANPLPGTAKFLFEMLRAVTRLTSGNIVDMEWDNMPLIMTNDEVHAPIISDHMNLRPVLRNGDYGTPHEYIETYFRLLRTDCFSSLKKGIRDYLNGSLDKRDMNIYINVVLCGIELGKDCLYLALKVTPTQKIKNWETSSCLMFGNLLCLSVGGNFKNLIWATVADRSLLKTDSIVLVQSCNEFNSSNDGEMIIDMLSTCHPIVMAESPTYYRAYQPVLKTLQAIEPQDISFRDEIVHSKKGPCFFDMNETFNADLVYKGCDSAEMITLQEFLYNRYNPSESLFDKSQEMAVKEALRSSIGIIQGPPGSGKSFIGVKMLRLLLSMPSMASSKILILTYKNHALDEFVKSTLEYFPSKVVRIGGRSRDEDLDKVSLKNIRREGKKNYEFIDQINSIREEIDQMKENIEKEFHELNKASIISYASIFSKLTAEQQLGIIKDCDWRKSNFSSFSDVDDDGFQTKQKKKGKRKKITSEEVVNILKDTSRNGDKIMKLAYAAFKLWIPQKQCFSEAETILTGLKFNPSGQKARESKNIDDKKVDANDFDAEEIKEIEEERMSAVHLKGQAKKRIMKIDRIDKDGDSFVTFSRGASKKLLSEGYDMWMNCTNLWDLEPIQRVYFIQSIASKEREMVCVEFEEHVKLFDQKTNQLSEINNQLTVKMLEEKQIIASTITGASINHMLLKEIRPEVVIVEEAAEILEPQLVAAIGSWTKYMLLIGDHLQLRPSVETYELKRDFNFDLSMMERLINNNMPFTTLAMQNRQRPEFAELLLDIYPDLKTNTERVKNNLPATCLEKSSFFWNHNFPESKERSVTNEKEGERAVMLALFLIQQGYKPNQITILATYQGQTALIRRCLSDKLVKYEKYLGSDVNSWKGKDQDNDNQVVVHTVDMYQGDENDFVIVSLVRSNDENKIGFLGEINRRCVAQSRAKCGVYFLGNADMFQNNPTWRPMIKILDKNKRLGNQIGIICKHHPNVYYPVTDITLQTFCKQPCSLEMSCSIHKCDRICQPPHSHDPCKKMVSFDHTLCGHRDQRKCHENPDHVRCKSMVTFRFTNCPHQGKKQCHEDKSAIICDFQESVKLPSCGHLKTKRCYENVNDLKCNEKCNRVMKTCSHPCDHKCYEHDAVKSCNVCVEINKINAEKQRNSEEDQRRRIWKEIDAEMQEIRKKVVTKGEVIKEELHEEGTTAAEYLDIEDYVKKYIQPTHAWYPRVTKIEKVTNHFLKLKWLDAKRKLFDPEGRSVLKFHGTSDAGVEGITKEGFRLPTTGNPMYGFGVYFASDSSKSAQDMYTKGSNKLLLCDVLLGKPLTVNKACRDMTLAKLKKDQCDSLFAKRGTRETGGVLYDEFVIFEPYQAYPKYIIHYTSGSSHGNPASQIQFTTTSFLTGCKKILPTRGLKTNDPLDMHFRIAESQFLRLLNRIGKQNDLTVKAVEVYINPKLKLNFEIKLKDFERKYGASRKESEYLLLFHGTKSRDIVSNIMDNNFKKSIQGKFGPGVYFSEFPSYTFGYGGLHYLILSKVLPGKIFPVNHSQPLQPGYDSHGGIERQDADGIRYSEIVIFDTDQILPCYVIHI